MRSEFSLRCGNPQVAPPILGEGDTALRTARLCGPEQTEIGNHAAVGWGNAAIGLSRGGAAKTYPYAEANEDACAFATTPEGTLLAVADGHWGSDASRSAVDRLLEHHAALLLGPAHDGPAKPWESTARDLLVDLQQRILRAGGHHAPRPPRTTLCLALAFPERNVLNWLCVGDSLLFAVREGAACELGAAGETVRYLGSPADDAERLHGYARVGSESLRDFRALVLVTDGLSEPGIGVADPAASVETATDAGARAEDPELCALETVRALMDAGLAVQRQQRAGDNLAIAVGWLGAH